MQPGDIDVWPGLDVGKSSHHACALDHDGNTILDTPVDQDEKRLRRTIAKLQRRGTLYQPGGTHTTTNRNNPRTHPSHDKTRHTPASDALDKLHRDTPFVGLTTSNNRGCGSKPPNGLSIILSIIVY